MDKLNKLIEKISGILKDKADMVDGESYDFKIYTDYRDRELSVDTLKDIMDGDNPKETFQDLLYDWAFDYEANNWTYETSQIKERLTEEELEVWEEHEYEITEWFNEHVHWYYDENDFNNEVCVNLVLDTGDANYDFTCNNVLNYYGEGEFEEESSILWLARQQKREKELLEAVNIINNENERFVVQGRFTKSVIEELQNLTGNIGYLTFLLKMDLFELFELKESIENKTGHIVIDKDTHCGLFNSWNGSGSLLEINLDKDVVIPMEYIWDAWIEGTKMHGYDVCEVYGLYHDYWNGTVKEM